MLVSVPPTGSIPTERQSMHGYDCKVRLTKKNLSIEPRRAKSATDFDMRTLRNGVMSAAKLSGFYHDHIDKQKHANAKANIMPRDATQILSQMRAQRVYVCERVEAPSEETLAASMLWDDEIAVPCPTTERASGYRVERFLEIGTQVSELPGFNLQSVLTYISLLESFLYDPTGTVFAATYGDAIPTATNFRENMRFTEWVDVPPTLLEPRIHHLEVDNEAHRGVNWFRPTIQTLQNAAQLLVSLRDEPLRTAKPTRDGRSLAINTILVEFDQNEFRKTPLNEVMRAAEDICKKPPKRFSDLVQFSSRSLSETFLYLRADERD